MLYKWPEFQSIDLFYLFLFIFFSFIIILIIYYFKFYEKKLNQKFLILMKKTDIPVKDYDDLHIFYEYYKKNYPPYIRRRELEDKKKLYYRFLEWYPEYVDNVEKNRTFLRILRHFFYKQNSLEFSFKMVDNLEPISIEGEDSYNIGIIKKITKKESIVLMVRLVLEKNYSKEKEYNIVFYRPLQGEIIFKGKIEQITKNQCYIYIEGEGTVQKEKIMTIQKIFGEVSFYHPEYKQVTKKIPFTSERTSLRGMKIEFKEDIENFLNSEFKDLLKNKIPLQNLILKLEIYLNQELLEIEGKIIAKYKSEANKYLIAYRVENTAQDLEKIEILKRFIKSNQPQAEKF